MNRRWFKSLAAFALMVPSICARAGIEGPDSAKAIELSQSVIGKQVADYAFTDSRGRARRFADYRGKPLLVNCPS